MARLLKIFLVLIAGIVGIVAIAAVALFLFFDPNDFRDRISVTVKAETGRDLNIAGDINLSLFPWLAVELGRTELGNAEGFNADQFLSFDQAKLSVRLLPLIVSQKIEVGTASLDGLVVNLEVAANGTTNWDDLANGEGAEAETADEGSGGTADFDVGDIKISNASATYSDRQSGSTYSVTNLSVETSKIGAGIPIDLRSEFDFDSAPGELGGHLGLRATANMTEGARQVSMEGLNVSGMLRGLVAEPTDFNFDSRALSIDTVAQSMNPGEMDLTLLGLSMSADVEPFSYAGTPKPVAVLSVAEFSLTELMQTLEIDPPVTADPSAMQRVSFKARAAVGDSDINLSDMTLELDESLMTGMLSLPTTANGALRFDLAVDTITLDGYMAPADNTVVADSEEASDVEIPVDLIRTLNVNGKLKVQRAYMTGLEFENLELGVSGSGGKLRLNPLSAQFYDGAYDGDVRIDASDDVPSVSANENINGVNVGALAKAMYDVENITGTVNGRFVLSGSGPNISSIKKDLDGNMSFEFIDGAWEGTDVWHQIRSARALFRQEPQPEPDLPARTEFSTVQASGVVTNGVFENKDFIAELPFLQVTGAGIVDLGTSGIDYAMQVRVYDRPEVATGMSAEELAEFTETVVPLKITGTLNSPKVRPDMEGIFRSRVDEAIEEKKDEIKGQLLNRLLGGDEQPPNKGADGEAGEVPEEASDEETEEDLEEKLKKDLLKKIFER